MIYAGSVGSLHIPGRTFPVEQFFLEDLIEAKLQATAAGTTTKRSRSSTASAGTAAGGKQHQQQQQEGEGDVSDGKEGRVKMSGTCEGMPEGARLATGRRGGVGGAATAAATAGGGGGGGGAPEQNQYQVQMLKGYQVRREFAMPCL